MSGKLGAAINWPIDAMFRHFDRRFMELGMALGFLGEGILLVCSPDSIQAGAFKFLLLIFSVNTVVVVYFIVGVSRIIALGLNGHWMPYGAYMRAAGAAAGAVMMAQMAAALITYGTHGNTLPFGTPFFGVWALLETVSMYRAILGAKAYGRRLDVGDSDHIALAPGARPVSFGGDARWARDYLLGPQGVQIRSAARG